MTEVGRLVIESGEVAEVVRADAPELLSTNGMFGFGLISARVRVLSEEEPMETSGCSFEAGVLTLDAEPRVPYYITEVI